MSAEPYWPCIAIAPDSFKGTLSAQGVASALAAGLRQALPQVTALEWPMADGGEGTLIAFQALVAGDWGSCTVPNAVGRLQPVSFYHCNLKGHPSVVIEVAQCVGITDAIAMTYPVTQRSTLGIGELIRQRLNHGDRHFYMGLGGSCTNDGGAGLLVALGVKLLDRHGQALPPTPEGFASLDQVDCSNLDARLQDCTFRLLSDVNNPLCGEEGATHTFGAQKGLQNRADRDRLDHQIHRFATLVEQVMGQQYPHRAEALQSLQQQPGTGAAGGLGFALQLLGGHHESGARFIAEQLQIPHHLRQVDWLITGEGCSDRQTLQGKAPWVVAQMAQAASVPVTLLSGQIVPEDRLRLTAAFRGDCFSLAPGASCCFPEVEAPSTLEACCLNAAHWLEKAGVRLGEYWLAHNLPRF